jgi:hypothetical protein
MNTATRTIVAVIGVTLAIAGISLGWLFLVGGGIAAQIVFAPITWAVATRINKPLTWWRKVLPEGLRRRLAGLWLPALLGGTICLLMGLAIAVFGYVPGVTDAERILAICWAFIFVGGLGMYLLAFVAGFAHDIERRPAMLPA